MDIRYQGNSEVIERQETLEEQLTSHDTTTNASMTFMAPSEEVIIVMPGSISMNNDIDDSEENVDPCCAKVRPLRPLLYLGPIASGIMDAADIGKSLYTGHHTSLLFVITGAGSAFFSAIGLTLEDTRKSFDETCKIVKTQRLPRTWARLSNSHEVTAICLTLSPTIWIPFSQSIQAYYFVNAIPTEYNFIDNIDTLYWSVFSGVIGLGAGFTTILTDNMENYKLIRDRIAGVRKPYQNTFSKYVSPALGFGLGSLKTFQDAIQSYEAIKSVFNVTNLQGKMLIAAPNAFIHVFFKLFFDSVSATNVIDEFFGYIQKRKFEPKKALAFSMVTALSVYLAFLKRPLTNAFNQDVANDFQDFGFHATSIPNEVFEFLSWAVFIEESLLITAALYHPMHHVVNKVTNTIGSFSSSIYHYCCPPPPPSDDNSENVPLLIDVDDKAEPDDIGIASPIAQDEKKDDKNEQIDRLEETEVENTKKEDGNEEEHKKTDSKPSLLSKKECKLSEFKLSDHTSTLYGIKSKERNKHQQPTPYCNPINCALI